MKFREIKVKSQSSGYSIIIGKNILNILSKRIRKICPDAKKIGLIIDSKVPKIFKKKIIKNLKNYEIFIFEYATNENLKSFKNVNSLTEKCLKNNFNRSDVALGSGSDCEDRVEVDNRGNIVARFDVITFLDVTRLENAVKRCFGRGA